MGPTKENLGPLKGAGAQIDGGNVRISPKQRHARTAQHSQILRSFATTPASFSHSAIPSAGLEPAHPEARGQSADELELAT